MQIVQLAERLLAQTFEGVTENPKHPVYAAETATEVASLTPPEEEMSYANINEAAEQARQFIEELVAPGKMTKTEAVNFLELVIVDCEGSIDSLKEELEDQ